MKFAKLIFPLLFLSIFLSIPRANADLLIEPLIGFSSGNFESELDEEEHSTSGLSYGGRLGYQKLGFQLGVDYLKSSLNVDKKAWGDLDVSDWSAFVGYQFPILFRIYAGYILSSVADTDYLNQNLKLKIN